MDVLRSSNCNGNHNGKWDTSKGQNDLKTDNSYYWLNGGGVVESCFGYFFFAAVDIFALSAREQTRAEERELWTCCEILLMRGMRVFVQRRELKLTRVSESMVLSCDKDEHSAIVRNVVPSYEEGISPATVKLTEAEEEGAVGGALEERREECSVPSVSSELDLSRVCEQNASLGAVLNEYKEQVNNLKKKVDEKKSNKMALLRELNWSNESNGATVRGEAVKPRG